MGCIGLVQSGLTCQTRVKTYLSVSGASWEHSGAALSKIEEWQRIPPPTGGFTIMKKFVCGLTVGIDSCVSLYCGYVSIV